MLSGANSHGKGDDTRIGVPHEVYGLRFDLAHGHITREQFDAQIDEAWARAKRRGWHEGR